MEQQAEMLLALVQRRFDYALLTPHDSIPHSALYGGHQAGQTVLQHEIPNTGFEQIDSRLFAYAAREQDHRHQYTGTRR